MHKSGKTLGIKRIILLAAGCLLIPAFSHVCNVAAATVDDEGYFDQLEKAAVSDSTKKIQYRRGRYYTKKNSLWKRTAVVSLTGAKMTFAKKGWYTVRITMKSGRKKLLHLKLKKKTYVIAANQPVSQKEGFYELIPKTNTAQAAGAKEFSLHAGSRVTVAARSGAAGQVWELEAAGKKRFRLKNANSGLYMALKDISKKNTRVVQKKYQPEDRGQLFQAARTGGSYFIKSVGSGRYLHTDGAGITTGKRKNKKAWKYKLSKTVRPESGMTVEGATCPTSLLAGSPFVLKGTVSSHYTIETLTASVLDGDGRSVLTKTVSPDACTYSLSGVDAAITFGRLEPGTYTYRVTATDKEGGSFTVINRAFSVYTQIAGSAKTLFYNAALISQIGHQSTGTALEKKACASYALAYCNAILYGTAPSPHTYWMGEETVDCVWSRGGYTTYAHASELAVLQAAYGQISEGRPCILHVTGKTSQHWVTVVGFKNVDSANALSAANFLAIDPWDGALITVSDRYQVKSTYRLAYKSQP